MDYAEVRILNLKTFNNKLAALEPKMERRIIKDALKQSHKILLNVAKAKARSLRRTIPGRRIKESMSSLMARTLVQRYLKKRKGDHRTRVQFNTKSEGRKLLYYPKGARTVARRGGGVPTKDNRLTIGRRTFIPAAIEFGHGKDKEKASRPFFRSAASMTKGPVMATFSRLLFKGVERALKHGN